MRQLELTTRARFREMPREMLFDSRGDRLRRMIGWFAIHVC